MKRLFIGISLPQETKSRIAKFLEDLEIPNEIRRIPEKNWHLTLEFLGDVETDQEKTLLTTLLVVQDHCSPFTLCGKTFSLQPTYHPHMLWFLWEMSPKWTWLVSEVRKTTQGIRGDHFLKTPLPHITLAKWKDPSLLSRLEKNFEKECQELAMPIQSFHLYESQLRPEGSMYRILHSFPFST